MPKLTVQDIGTVDVESGTRLVTALKEHGGDPLHRCGGNARCTTCRVEFISGEPEKITQAEQDKLESQGNMGKFRLSCQCLVEDDMHVKVLMPFADSGLDDPGPKLEDQITPQAVWITK
ncbi:MAG: (2Fe-2S)-binding protein [Chloroflexi bacterium]|nr:(2Fe-2S)-binding protein [Chloroflexota bacterium]